MAFLKATVMLLVASMILTLIPAVTAEPRPSGAAAGHVLIQTKALLSEKVEAAGQDPSLTTDGPHHDAQQGYGPSLFMFLVQIILGAIMTKGLFILHDMMDPLKKTKHVVITEALTKSSTQTNSEQSKSVQPGPAIASSPIAELASAARVSDVVRVGELFEAGVKVDGTDDWGCTALHVAANAGSLLVVQMLLKRGFSADTHEAWDETPLHFAARGGSAEVIEVLLAHGASIDAQNADDKTPLVIAAIAGHEAACEVLLDRGAGAGDMPDDEVPSLLAALVARRSILAVLGTGSRKE
mmetsp:Transcript_153717/g.492837  ORF Transcript_153717/g.492837 Transcript_153717/m.492837 type:complete len:297 (-) Transcript_153717:309-1199(-)|eukprot:CAMPEP_0203866710 /NCGR_PEP_ID=MMETSP0359-20131031/16105_1 /ASSEMBLY_ACC=CAM_ASM_000338 /TAXON_ID=268821 /ORGANISM="Scrippsiella Hangoei, Strain SHTV-5" /LENGTH=296 /DNA_ID=CAMNT_0050784847 /DNA_START=92 /DNA_END=982 /DNA_ORIENTATION=-